MAISAVNLLWLTEPHDLQGIHTTIWKPGPTRYLDVFSLWNGTSLEK